MDIKNIVKEIIENNEWLSGMYDYRDGNLMAIVNRPEIFEGEPLEVADLKKLYSNLRNYQGTYRYKNLLFFNDMQYGVFIYDINKDRKHYVEHLSIHAMTFENFRDLVENVMTS